MRDEKIFHDDCYSPYPVDWRFLPDRVLLAKDAIRYSLVRASNSIARNSILSPFWVATVGRRTITAIRSAKILFVHIPKTAGTSISACLYGRNLPHFKADFYVEVLGKSIYGIKSFSIIRNPVERFVSSYKMASIGGTKTVAYDRYSLSKLQGLESFEKFVEFVYSNMDLLEFLPLDLHTQSSFIRDNNGKILVDVLFSLDKHRGLPQDLGPWLGLQRIPHLNATRRQEIVVSREIRDKIEEIYKSDCELYDEILSGKALYHKI